MENADSWKHPKLAHYEFSVEIEASASRVWRALTDQIGSWWLPNFHMLGASSIVELEAHAGGRLFERAEGRELLWYTVIAIDTEKSIDFAGYCTAKYGGPATTMLSMELTSVSERLTRLQISDSLFGRVTDEFVRCVQDGWKELFSDGLRDFVIQSSTY
jgi:uncharacterized protein YndB with AHSA1/START domain